MKHILFAIIWLAAVSLTACAAPLPIPIAAPVSTSTIPSDSGEEAQVRDLVESFGKRLQTVSLLAPDAAQELQKQYSGFVSSGLLETWTGDVAKAPGRMVSSPWPDRIEITTLAREAPGRYVIDGFVVELTSTEIVGGGAANEIPVHIVAEKDQAHWLITEYAEGQ